MRRSAAILLGTLTGALIAGRAKAETANSNRGQRVCAACAACHSLEPDRNMTGPSLANLWSRKAGSLASFARYSSALKASGVVWNDKTLDEWTKDPAHLIPDNQMVFQGIKNDQQRADLLSFLKQATQPGSAAFQAAQGSRMAASVPNLKKLDPEDRVQKIAHRAD